MTNQGKELYEFGPFRLDPVKRLLLRDNQPVPLQPKAFETLLALVRTSEQVLSKDDLMKIVWPDTFVEESNLAQNVFVLRKALGETTEDHRYIVTVPGKGYRFVGELRTLAAQIEIQDDLIVESRTRSRIVVEEEIGETSANEPTLSLGGGGQRALPGQVSAGRPHWPWIFSFTIFVIALGAVGLWAAYSPAPAPKVLRVVRLTHSGRISPYSKVLTDGSRLYFSETTGGAWGLTQVPIAGGEESPIATSLPSVILQDIDPTRSKLLVSAQSLEISPPLWMLSTAGGSAQRLGDVAASDSSWSPDGQHIAYGREGSIYIADANAEHPRLLLSIHGLIEFLHWSPDGMRFRFTVADPADGGRSLWEANADGRNPHPLSLGWKNFAHGWGEGEYGGDWTPDGEFFVFRSVRYGVESFWAIREKSRWLHKATGIPVQIYTSPDHVSEPRFSTDGKKIFFVGYREQRELVRYDSTRQQFVPYLGGIPARLLTFSSDGQWVAYRSDIDSTLWRSRVDGTDKLQLTFRPLFVTHSSWSPDGKTLVFQGSAPGESAKLYTVPFTGGKPELLLEDDKTVVAAPSWCGDGRSILFMRWSKDTAGGGSSGVSLLDMNTHHVQLLPGTAGFDGVHCSPDGKFAAASDEANHRLVLYDFSRQLWSTLAEGAPYGWGIRWSADSRYVYYQHAEGNEEQPIFRVRIHDRAIEQISSLRQMLRADVLSCTMTGLAPDDSPLASLVRRTSDVYGLELEIP